MGMTQCLMRLLSIGDNNRSILKVFSDVKRDPGLSPNHLPSRQRVRNAKRFLSQVYTELLAVYLKLTRLNALRAVSFP